MRGVAAAAKGTLAALAAQLALAAGVTAQTLPLELTAGDYVDARLATPHAAQVALHGPDRRIVRTWQLPSGESELLFVAPASGPYELRASGAAPAGERRLTLHERVPAAQLVASPPPRDAAPQSPLLKAWIERDGAGTDAFWAGVAQHGTPLVEPAGDGGSQLVTLLWRGGDTRSLRTFWPIRAAQPEAFSRVPGSDVWHLTLRLPPATRMSYQLAPDVPQFADGPRLRQRRAVLATAQADPLNRKPWPRHDGADRYSTASLIELPQAPGEPWLAPRPGVARGDVQTLRFHSARLGNQRDVTIYTPPGEPRGGAALPLLLLFDRDDYLTRVPTPTILDNLIADRRIPPLVAVLVANPSRDARAAELPCNETFAQVVVDELLPWVRTRVAATTDATRVVAAGSSYGGLAAACLALRHPQSVGRVLALSGSFWWSPERDPQAPAGGLDDTAEAEWAARQFAAAPRADVAFFLAAGLFERSAPGDSIGILEANRHLRTVLTARGHPVHYREFAGGHDYVNWRGMLPVGLITLLGQP